MVLLIYASLLAIATGFVSGGLTGEAWAMTTGSKPGLHLLTRRSLATPLKVAALVLHAPLLLAVRGWPMITGGRPVLGIMACIIAGAWSFFQGVFILTQVFGVT